MKKSPFSKQDLVLGTMQPAIVLFASSVSAIFLIKAGDDFCP